MHQSALAHHERPEAHRGRRPTVVIADDNEYFLGGMVRALRRRDDVELVRALSDGAQALRAIRELHPDVAVVDARMPVLDGLALARTVADDPALSDTRVVLLSARADDGMVADALEAGAARFLDKSRSRREICAVVAGLAAPRPGD